jgi:UDP-N-acetylmuramoyl-tripeptide--D-alanyl-D-alanine ligase
MSSLYNLFLQYPYISTDTRKIVPDSIFVCLKGDNFDGNRFALQALEKGAKYVVTEDRKLLNNPHCIVVDDCLKTLQKLSLFHRRQLKIPVIGITGTNGKTTTKELIAAVLSKKYSTAYTKGNLNNHIGVPLTLLDIKPQDEIAIVEMGANHVGEIADLCKLSLPDFGVITNIGKAHIEGFGSVENIIATKAALYHAVIENKGTIFVNADDNILMNEIQYGKVVRYGQKCAECVCGEVIKMTPYLVVRIFDRIIETNLTGFYNLYNILCAAAIGNYFEVPDDAIADAIAGYIPSNNRSQIVRKESNLIIADYYNANPTSMEAALNNLFQIDFPNKAAILGDMFELGNVSKEEHLRIIDICEKQGLATFFIGNEFYGLHPDRENFFPNVDAFNDSPKQPSFENTMLLIKGSRGVHLEKLNFLIEKSPN